MINVEQALRYILKSIRPLPNETVELIQAFGRTISQDINSRLDIPGLDNSAMDGYAVRSEDTIGASLSSPRILKVVEDLKAGYLSHLRIGKNQAIRIMTGAPIPEGADGVVIVEDTERDGDDRVKIFKEIKHGENIRRKGEDIRKGEKIVSKGTYLSPPYIGIVASLGRKRIRVARRPKVAILATGDEVVDVGEKLSPGKLYSSNTYTLYSQVIKYGGIPKNLGIARDSVREIKEKIRRGLNCDLILTSGGVSVGEYDLVKTVLTELGDIEFWKVAMRPGKPLAFGKIKGVPLFGLPGNPVSSMVSFEVFVRPAILKMLGQRADASEIDAVLEEDIKKKKGFRYFLRAETWWKDGTYYTRTTGPQGSGILKSMALANSLMILSEERQVVKRGEKVKVRFLY